MPEDAVMRLLRHQQGRVGVRGGEGAKGGADRLGPAAVPHMIISTCESVSDVFEALLLAKEAGLAVDIVPLFETIGDLEAAASILDRLLAHPVYAEWRQHNGLDLYVPEGTCGAPLYAASGGIA